MCFAIAAVALLAACALWLCELAGCTAFLNCFTDAMRWLQEDDA